MVHVVYNGSGFDEESLIKAVKRSYALISMLEAVQYASHDEALSNELGHIGAEMRAGIDDNVIADLRGYISDIEEIIGAVARPDTNPAMMAQAMEEHMALCPDGEPK